MSLTKRELEVLKLSAEEGLEAPEIAEKLSISAYTVKTHVFNILNKFGANNLKQAIYFACMENILQKP